MTAVAEPEGPDADVAPPRPPSRRTIRRRIRAQERQPRSALWTMAVVLFVAGALAGGLAAYLVTRPLVNPGVQDCGTPWTFVVDSTPNVVIRPGEPGAPPDAVELASQPTCRELVTVQAQKAGLAFGAWVGLWLLGFALGVADDRRALRRAPRFETYLRPMPRPVQARYGLQTDYELDELGAPLPLVPLWRIATFVAMGLAGLVGVVALAGGDAASAAVDRLGLGGALATAVAAVATVLVAVPARWGAFGIAAGRAALPGAEDGAAPSPVAAVLAACWAGRIRPGLWAFGVDAEHLRRLGSSASVVRPAVASYQLAALVVQVVVLAWAVRLALGGGDGRLSVPMFVALGLVAVIVLAGLTQVVSMVESLPVRPGRASAAGWRALLERPERAVAVVGGAIAQPLVETLVLVVALQAAGGSIAIGWAVGTVGVATLLGVLSQSPGGAGVVEVALFLGLVWGGADTGAAAVAVVLARVLAFWVPMAIGTVVAGRLEGRGAL